MSNSSAEQNEPPADSAWGHHSPPTEDRTHAAEPPGTLEEFTEITGIVNKEPDAIGVAVTVDKLHEHRQQKNAVSGETPKDSTGSAPDTSKT